MSRTVCLLLAIIAFTNAYYLGNYYVGSLPFRRIRYHLTDPSGMEGFMDEETSPIDALRRLLPLRRRLFVDSQYDSRLPTGQLHGVRDISGVDGPFPQQKEKKDLALIKRFKPCYYSPIQCLIKRR